MNQGGRAMNQGQRVGPTLLGGGGGEKEKELGRGRGEGGGKNQTSPGNDEKKRLKCWMEQKGT